MNDGRISLRDDLQHTWFTRALNTLGSRRLELNDYDYDLWRKLQDGYEFSGRDLTITVKQMNHIKQVAAELEARSYGR